MYYSSEHKFHIPVMGLAYTIDTPIKVARFGISSAISIVEDRLVEMMRGHYYQEIGMAYHPISTHEPDFRAKRITDYLNLVNSIVDTQIEKLRNAVFETGSEIVQYFEMLPDDSTLKRMYLQMMRTADRWEKEKLAIILRSKIKPGSIDVNILTKTDRDKHDKNGNLSENGSDAVAALRGYAKSDLSNSSVIFSAGLNPRLFSYLEQCTEFDVNDDGGFMKKIIVKVSDYRSALIQGKYLAKKGIWVSEFRVESGLNCGGHAFATDGYLMGPILEEFRARRQEFIDTIFEIYNEAQEKKRNRRFVYPPKMIFTAQGGIGTHEEDEFLRKHYELESTGWGTPFLLVPEATTVDEDTLKKLCDAKTNDIVLSRNSPLGVRFYYLKGTSAANEKELRISNGKPGSPCTEKHLASNTEFTKQPICTASHQYQKLKIAQLHSLDLPVAEYRKQLKEILDKECLCVGLSNAAAIKYKRVFIKTLKAVTICPGPNIVNFSRLVSLQTMTDHIYGRKNIITTNNRPHMFIAELHLYIQFLKEQLEESFLSEQFQKKKKYFVSFYQNLRGGMEYYSGLDSISAGCRNRFDKALHLAGKELDFLNQLYAINEPVLASVRSGTLSC